MRKAHVRPGGLEGHGGLRTPCFGERALTRPRPGSGDSGDTGDAGAPLRGDGKAVVQSGVSRRPIGPNRSYMSYMSYRVAQGRTGDAGDTGTPLRGDRRSRCAKRRQPPSYRSYASYMSYRVVYQSANQLISQILCVPLWSFVFLAVEGLALWACTVIAAQREACPSLQTSKLPSFHANRLRGKTSPESRQSGRGGDLLCYSLWIGLLRTRILGMRRCG